MLYIHSVIIQLSVLNLPFWKVYEGTLWYVNSPLWKDIISRCKYIFSFVSLLLFLSRGDVEKSGFVSFN